MDEDGVSARQLSKQASDAGYQIGHQTISKLAAGVPSSWPEPTTMRALAYLLRTTERAVLLSFGKSFGMAVETVEMVDLVPAEFDAAPQPIKDAALRLMRAIAESVSNDDPDSIRPVPERTLRNPRTVVGVSDTTPSAQSTRRSTSN